MAFFVFVKMGKAPLSRALREIKQLLCVQSLILYYIKQIDSMLPCICPVIDHRGRQNVVRTSVTHSAIASCATFLFLPHFDVICDLLLDRCTATWNLFVKFIILELFAILGLPHNDIEMINSKSILEECEVYWKDVQTMVGDEINSINCLASCRTRH